MSFVDLPPVEPLIDAILNDHFENHENPHETLYKIWLLINARTLLARRDSRHDAAAF
jgi:hypothetical protein